MPNTRRPKACKAKKMPDAASADLDKTVANVNSNHSNDTKILKRGRNINFDELEGTS